MIDMFHFVNHVVSPKQRFERCLFLHRKIIALEFEAFIYLTNDMRLQTAKITKVWKYF